MPPDGVFCCFFFLWWRSNYIICSKNGFSKRFPKDIQGLIQCIKKYLGFLFNSKKIACKNWGKRTPSGRWTARMIPLFCPKPWSKRRVVSSAQESGGFFLASCRILWENIKKQHSLDVLWFWLTCFWKLMMFKIAALRFCIGLRALAN